MKKQTSFALLVVLAFGATTLMSTIAQVKKGKTRPLTTEQLMAAIVKPYSSICSGDMTQQRGIEPFRI